ncbi:MAG: hypothetical protein J6T43_00610 [Prevotella sp.]|nr:hypothetical protein [Prevotella sp.]
MICVEEMVRLARKKQYAGEKKASMKRRDEHHDYTERRMYMITLELEGRRPLFGHLVGDAFAPVGSEYEPRIELSELGCAVQSEWMGIHGYYPQIEVVAVQMMPDHMHGILFVKAPLPVHLGQVISGFKAGCRKRQRALAAAEPQPTRKGDSLQVAALPLQDNGAYIQLFAKGYNDLILRSYDELPAWKNYLRDNPRRLMMKRANPDNLRPFFDLHIGSHTYNGIGNRRLLSAPRRIAVRLSRRLSKSDIEMETKRYLEVARQGAVLISPAISPGEKCVMRAAFNAGLPTIVLLENGFTPLSKPHGEQFYACAKGHLLMLSPWKHHNEKRTITAQQCMELNLMALDLCKNNG